MSEAETIQNLKDDIKALKHAQSQQTLDHDLIIKIDGNVGRLILDVRELKEDLSARVKDVENDKASKEEVGALRLDLEKSKTDIDTLKQFRWTIIGVAIVVQFVGAGTVLLFLKYFLK